MLYYALARIRKKIRLFLIFFDLSKISHSDQKSEPSGDTRLVHEDRSPYLK